MPSKPEIRRDVPLPAPTSLLSFSPADALSVRYEPLGNGAPIITLSTLAAGHRASEILLSVDAASGLANALNDAVNAARIFSGGWSEPDEWLDGQEARYASESPVDPAESGEL